MTGTVVKFDKTKKYGFIRTQKLAKDVFVHAGAGRLRMRSGLRLHRYLSG